jgi:predicted oxidoreductase (fatty acid repression mutant protein)
VIALLTELRNETRRPYSLLFTWVSDSRIQSFNRQSSRVVFARRQTTERVGNFFPGQLDRICDFHSFDHFSEHGTAGERGRTTISQETRGFDATVAKPQAQTQTIAADRVRLFRDRVRIRQFAGVTRIRQMIFESF